MTQTIINVLILLHVYLIIRYCIGNIFPSSDLDRWTRFKHVMLVALVPFFGYYWAVKREDIG